MRRWLLYPMIGFAITGVAYLNVGWVFGINPIERTKQLVHEHKLNSQGYKETHGRWETVHQSHGQRLNAIHVAMLPTGKVLLVAGSGNNAEHFKARTFKMGLFDPKTGITKVLPAPEDLFCAGQAFLSNGKLLFGGGVQKYEVLDKDVTHAAGVMEIRNESSDIGPITLPRGTELTGPNGKQYRTAKQLTVKPATKEKLPGGRVDVQASSQDVWVEAAEKGAEAVVSKPAQYELVGLRGKNIYIYGLSDQLTLKKQEYSGANFSYEFDPFTETFAKVDVMVEHRWYPSLVGLTGGQVLAVSGLDEFGRIIQGNNEIYNQRTQQWNALPKFRVFPTYPALFLTERSDTLLYTGSNAGYGSDEIGRTPGLWNWRTNAFANIPGLRDAKMTETSASVLLPPANSRRYMILGGGGIGESNDATRRTDIVDLSDKTTRFKPGPDLPVSIRYPNTVILPNDEIMVSGGSSRYRGRSRSDQLVASLLDRSGRAFKRVAAPSVPRTYHSAAMLLPDGRVLTVGGDPLFSDKHNREPGKFEQRIELYSPPYLYKGKRPIISGNTNEASRGGTITFSTPDSSKIVSARLIRPSAVTHTTDLEQRSISLGLRKWGGEIELTIPKNPGLVPGGWYMLFVTNANGVPSEARFVKIS